MDPECLSSVGGSGSRSSAATLTVPLLSLWLTSLPLLLWLQLVVSPTALELWFLFVFGKMEITKSFRRTLPHASGREGFASAGLNFHVASADPFRNGYFAEFGGLASASAGWSPEEAVCLGKPIA